MDSMNTTVSPASKNRCAGGICYVPGGDICLHECAMREIKAKGVLRIGTPADYLPFSYMGKEGLEGVDIDAAVAFARFLGVEPVFVNTTWKELLEHLHEGRFHIAVGGIAISKERRRKALFSATYFRTGKAPIALREKAGLYGSLEEIDRPGVRVIVNPGGTNEAFAKKRLLRADICVHRDNMSIFDALLEDKADLMITDAVEALVWERRYPQLKAVNPRRPFTCAKFAWMISAGEHALKAVLDEWLVKYCAGGGIKKSLLKWTDRIA